MHIEVSHSSGETMTDEPQERYKAKKTIDMITADLTRKAVSLQLKTVSYWKDKIAIAKPPAPSAYSPTTGTPE
jgi:hypothetical protein